MIGFEERFSSEKACREYLSQLRRPKGYSLGDDPLYLCHLIISLFKRWLLGTYQGAVKPPHLDYYLDEYTFRFNRRKSRSCGKLFYRLVQQAVSVEPVSHYDIEGGIIMPCYHI